MGKKKGHRAKTDEGRPDKKAASPKLEASWKWWWTALGLAAVLLVFYWTPLTSPEASIHWDAVDVHYSSQKYFSDSIRAGKLPHWTPYIYSGFPFLADPQTAAWYPLHWPFFLFGVTPKGLQLGLVLHCLIALFGTYLLVREYYPRREVAALGALAYAFCGYFAGHSSDIGNFGGAAWLPWLLLILRRAVLTGRAEWMVLAGLVVGLNALLGHFQTTLYCLFAAGMFCLAHVIEDRRRLASALAGPVVASVLGLLISAVLIVPGLELTGESIRSGMTFGSEALNALLVPSALATLVAPNALGAIQGPYEGPADITQFYFYAGILLLPLAALGCRRSSVLVPGLALIVPAIWYAFGTAGGLYHVLTQLPGFASVRAPVQIWFVVALGLALLAAAGFSALLKRWNYWYVALGIPLFFFADLTYWNSAQNPLAYERVAWEASYGSGLRLFQDRIASKLPALTRFHAPFPSTTFGPLNHPLNSRAETTYGYNPLELRRYREYTEAAKKNPKLLDGLNVSRVLDIKQGAVISTDSALPRAYFPPEVISVGTDAEAREQLGSLDPSKSAVVVAGGAANQDSGAVAEVTEHTESTYTITYRCASESLLRIAVPYYPGWRATVNGEELSVIPVDHALLGVVVPAGQHELRLEFRLPRFWIGALVSLFSVLAVAGFLVIRRKQIRPVAGATVGG